VAGIFDGMSALKEVTVMDKSNITFVKNTFKDCPLLEKLTVGDCNVVFATGTNEYTSATIINNCPNFQTIDITKADATFNKYSFASDKTIKNLLMGEGNTYIFKEDSFRHSVLEEVILPDNSNVTLDKKCFAETLTIKYIYVGKNCIANGQIGDDTTNTSIFGGNAYLNKVVLMEGINYISKWSLSTKKTNDTSAYKDYKTLSDLYIYAHSETIRFNSEAFNDRTNGDFKVYLYTINPNITSITSTSNYVIYRDCHMLTKREL
jgi:hypothetical protein